MFWIVKKRILLLFIGFFLLSGGVVLIATSVRQVDSPNTKMSIVIDCGHGGDDGGAIGKLGVSESYLNLQYGKELRKLCEDVGFRVVMTRSDMNGLYSATAQNKKRSEMEKRAKIINESGATLVVSIHMNSFPLQSCRGAQVFYRKENEGGKELAQNIQKQFSDKIIGAKTQAKEGDFFVLNCTEKPAVLVECGFLSNEEEEKSLCDENYRKEFCKSLLMGILEFYSA